MAKNTKALRIEGEMTIYRAAELRQQMQPLLGGAAKAPGAIDLSAVTEIDCSGIQLLALARRTATAAGRELRLDKPSPAVLEVFGLLGLDPLSATGA